ncbi:follistatin-related protein 1 [Zootermopsis nevadensis]|uniref:follistatin-related protein 1 n=1 Tax=Zootermopsis nevadensis TaxID=136037 RepID=UPI000B8EC12C|nr:follistatin-related protein 1 [Zootermopsis nevadensis]
MVGVGTEDIAGGLQCVFVLDREWIDCLQRVAFGGSSEEQRDVRESAFKMCHCGTELMCHRMLLLLVLIAVAFTHTASTTEQGMKDCSLRFQTCTSAEEHRRPVCGTDGVTYASRCHMQREQCQGTQVSVQHRGRCKGNGF